MYGNFPRRRYSDSHLISLHREHGHCDLIADLQSLADAASQDELWVPLYVLLALSCVNIR